MSRFWRCDRCEKEFQKDNNCISLDNYGATKILNIGNMDFCPECSFEFTTWLTSIKKTKEAADDKADG